MALVLSCNRGLPDADPILLLLLPLLLLYLLSSRKFFSDENGNLLQTGDIVKYEKLADTLEEIAAGGADALYKGRIGEDLIRDIQEEGRRSRGRLVRHLV